MNQQSSGRQVERGTTLFADGVAVIQINVTDMGVDPGDNGTNL